MRSSNLQDGRTALMEAATNNSSELATMLLDRGADVDATDEVSGALLRGPRQAAGLERGVAWPASFQHNACTAITPGRLALCHVDCIFRRATGRPHRLDGS